MIAVLILAAGASRRMRGRDKLLENIDGVPLLRRQVVRAHATGAPVFVTLPPRPHPRYDVLDGLEGLEITTVPVADAAEGMNASLRAGLLRIPAEAKAVMVLLADMPDLTESDLRTVLQEVDTSSQTLIWRATTQSGAAGHPTVFSAALIPALTALEGDAGGKQVAQKHLNQTRHIPLPEDHARTDLDTPEAWAAWRAAQS